MRLARAALAAAILSAASGAPARAATSCAAFMDAFVKAAPELQAQFVRPVVISRGTGEGAGDARDVVTGFGVDARLICVGDRFVRFEAQIPQRAQPLLIDGFNRMQVAATMAAWRWPRARASQTVTSMAADAAEFLRASQERGDIYISGKVDRHVGRGGEIGVEWTLADRSFIIISAD
ncbi:MAG: hypothetical protein ACK4MV_16925 [Beijerinckiaceae bacterium]